MKGNERGSEDSRVSLFTDGVRGGAGHSGRWRAVSRCSRTSSVAGHVWREYYRGQKRSRDRWVSNAWCDAIFAREGTRACRSFDINVPLFRTFLQPTISISLRIGYSLGQWNNNNTGSLEICSSKLGGKIDREPERLFANWRDTTETNAGRTNR